MMTTRGKIRTPVTLVRGTPGPAFGNHERMYAYSVSTLALLLGIKPASVRQAVFRGRLDPSDLESVLRYVAGRRGWKVDT